MRFRDFASSTHRVRRDDLFHWRSVRFPVACGGDDYTFVPPETSVPRAPIVWLTRAVKVERPFCPASPPLTALASRETAVKVRNRLSGRGGEQTVNHKKWNNLNGSVCKRVGY
jgi:hypothetical protein